MLCMRSCDQSASLVRILSSRTYAGHIRQLRLLQRTHKPLPPRLAVQHITILKIAPVTEAAVVHGGNCQVLARINDPKEAYLEAHAETIVVSDIGNEKATVSLRERIGQGGNRNHPDIIHTEPSSLKCHVVTGIQVKNLERKSPGRRLAFLCIAVRKPTLFHPIMVL